MNRFAIKQNAAAVRAHNADEDFHQRGLASAVFTDNRVNRAGLHFKRHAIQRDDAAVMLDESVNGYQRWGHGERSGNIPKGAFNLANAPSRKSYYAPSFSIGSTEHDHAGTVPFTQSDHDL